MRPASHHSSILYASLTALAFLELNPNHPLIVGLKDSSDQTLEDTAHVLFAQSLLLEGAEIPDRVDFVKRLNRLLR